VTGWLSLRGEFFNEYPDNLGLEIDDSSWAVLADKIFEIMVG